MSLVAGVAASAVAVSLVEPLPQASAAALVSPAPAAFKVASRPDELSAAVTARSQGSRVEVESARSETSTTWVNPDGSLTTDVAEAPVRYRDEAGAWQPVELGLVVGADGVARSSAGRASVAVARGGSDSATGLPLAVLGGEAASVTLRWKGKLPAPVIDGSTATYKGVAPGVDVVVQALREGFEQHVVLTQRRADVSKLSGLLALPLEAKGYSLAGDGQGGVAISDAAGKPAGYVPAPMMWDASVDANSGEHRHVSKVPMTVTGKGAKVSLALAPDWSFLSDPTTVYPVTIDPAVTWSTSFDTYVEQGFADQSASSELKLGNNGTPTTSYPSGQIARSILQFNTSGLSASNIKVTAATLSMYETYAWSCVPETWKVMDSATADQHATWDTQPAVYSTWATSSDAQGHDSTCAADWVTQDIKNLADAWAHNGNTYNTLELRATTETGTYPDGKPASYGWKRFSSRNGVNPPKISVTYDHVPNAAATPALSTISGSDGSYVYTSTLTPSFTTRVTDLDGNSTEAKFEVWTSTDTTTGTMKSSCTSTTPVPTGGTSSCALTTALADNTTYYVRALGYAGYQWSSSRASGTWVDVYSPWATIRTAHTAPPAPTVSCPGYTSGSWAATVPASAVSCTISATGTGYSAPVSVRVKVDAEATWTPRSLSNGTTSVSVPATAGGHQIQVQAVTAANLTTTAPVYGFGYGNAGLSSPAQDAVTSDRLTVAAFAPLVAGATAGTVTASLWYRAAGTADFSSLGANGSSDAAAGWKQASLTGNPAVTAANGGVGFTGIWNAAIATVDGVNDRAPVLLDVEVCFTYPGPVTKCTWTPDAASHVTVQRVPHAFGDDYPTADAGPGQVALFTGELSLGATDVSVPGYNGALSVSRSHTSFGGPDVPAAQIFGRGWTVGISGDAGGAADLTVVDNTTGDGSISLVDGEGSALVYREANKTHAQDPVGALLPADDDTAGEGSTLTIASDATLGKTLTYTEDDGTQTVWVPAAPIVAATATTWSLVRVAQAGTVGQTTYTREASGRVIRILAALPAGMTAADCPATGTMKPGCRALRLVYADSSNPGQVSSIWLDIYDPAVKAVTSTQVATYSYNSAHLLTSVTDPRSGLTTSYGYDTSDPTRPRVSSYTPPGQAAYHFTYDTSGPNLGRLAQVTRDANLSGGSPVPLTSVVYNLNPSVYDMVANKLPDLRAATTSAPSQGVGAWGQAAAPTHGFAVFGQGVAVTGTVPGSVTGDAWLDGDLTYTDDNGRVVNTASYGAGAWQVTATDYDTSGHTVRTLDARATAALRTVGAGSANDYGIITRYNGDIKDSSGRVLVPAGTYVIDEWGPSRTATLANGSSGWLRPHIHATYDTGAPNGDRNPATGLPFNLSTRVTVGAADASTPTTDPNVALPADREIASVTDSGYNPIDGADALGATSGWILGTATTTTSYPNGAAAAGITSKARYDSEGRAVENRQPASTGSDAGTTRTTYYTVAPNTTDSRCGSHPEWAGLVCDVVHAGQPATGASLPDSYAQAYSALLAPTSVVETSGSTATRTTKTGYDAAGRVTKVSAAATGVTGSTAAPAATTTYDAMSGLVTRQSTIASTGAELAAVATEYDSWGRQTSYAANGDTPTSTTYDSAGRTATVTDPKGTTTYGYGTDADGQVEKRDLPTRVDVTGVGTFTGAYDANGTLVEQHLPGGLTRTTTLDEAGEPTGLEYDGAVSGQIGLGAWLAWSQTNDVLGRVRQEWTPTGHAFTDPSGSTDIGDAISYDRAYSYDGAGRLVTVNDRTAPATGSVVDDPATDTTGCTTRRYGFDADGNRTSLTRIPAASGGACGTTGGTTTNWAIDAADRNAVSDGYVYDLLGRATTIPARDLPSGVGAVSLGYYDTDAVRSIATSANTETFTLDAAGRRLAATTTAAASSTASRTLTRHYTDGSDNPGWVTDTQGATTTTTRYAASLGGDLGASVNVGTGQIQLTLANLHGDVVTTVTLPSSSATASSIDGWSDYDEYGNARNVTATSSIAGAAGYGWLGAKQRSDDTIGTGLMLMGARLYNPFPGRFSSSDPVFGGGDNSYSYPTDPVNSFDGDGRCWRTDWFDVFCSKFDLIHVYKSANLNMEGARHTVYLRYGWGDAGKGWGWAHFAHKRASFSRGDDLWVWAIGQAVRYGHWGYQKPNDVFRYCAPVVILDRDLFGNVVRSKTYWMVVVVSGSNWNVITATMMNRKPNWYDAARHAE